MKTILIISQYFYPDISATGNVLTQLALDLIKAGYKVKVISGKSDGQIKKYENYNGIEIWRVKYFNYKKGKGFIRILSFFSFSLSVLLQLLSTRNYHSLLIVSNPPIVPFIGYLVKKVNKQIKFSYLLHDLYPDVAITTGAVNKTSILVKVMSWFNTKIFKSADHIIALGRDVKQRLLEKKQIEDHKIKIITNWADKKEIQKPSYIDFKKKLGIHEKFVVMYTGNLGLFYDLDYIIKALPNIKEYKDIALVFIGEGNYKEDLKVMVEELNLTNVYFFPFQDKGYYGDVLHMADVLLVTLAKGMEGISVPSKTYGYLAAGKPILGVLPKNSEIGMLIDEEKLGYRVDPQDIDDFCLKLIHLYLNEDLRSELGNNGKSLFNRFYERNLVTKKYIEIL